MKSHLFLSLSAAALAFTPSPALAQSSDPVGYVERKRGVAGDDVWIMREGKRIRAVAGAKLYEGDVVNVRGSDNFAILRVAGLSGAKNVKSGQRFTVPEVEEQGWMARFSSLVSNVGNALGVTDRVTSAGTYTRSARSGEEPTGEPATAQPLARVPALQSERLYGVRELSVLAPRWCGDALAVQSTSDGETVGSAVEVNTGFGSVDLRSFVDVEGGEEYPVDLITVVAAAGDDLKFGIDWIALGDVPRPAEIANLNALEAADKFAWANWLLADAEGHLGNAYNLIAFSLLAEANEEIWLAGLTLERASYCPASTDGDGLSGDPAGSLGE